MLRQANVGLILLLALLPTGAEAQVAAKWDVAAFAGLFTGHSPDPTIQQYQDEWFEAANGGVVVGRYLTPHLKLEVEASGSSEGTRFAQRYVAVPGVPVMYPVGAETRSSVASVASSVVWQFFENEWVHPFVSAGVTVDFDRDAVYTWPQQYYSGDPMRGGQRVDIPGGLEGPDRTSTLRPVLSAGVKMYVSPKLFFRGDGRVSLGRDRQHIALRIGFGADF